ncbi:lysophospholipid acyltransferase family protein [Aquicoccus sp. G2-2]|uniref:lysophospholipid acyltransferase family protein n=1 Tax=Aquicoccus sp. G2-2 TaxID=3092120 RepID=UPI002ADFCEC6|nr:lysophospholipid acyltransferase family protein [Aquicoccus sp. G2-2]MEA1113183.1 lysophospholipid acyltransferase family protein [Aquicoccus sp. G2-2]
MSEWSPDMAPPTRRIGPLGWVLVVVRALMLIVVVFDALGLMLLIRLIERPLCGMARPVTPWLTQAVCRAALKIIGIRLRCDGRPMRRRGAVVANHSSWLDIFVLNACDRVYFVSKAEVRSWPGIGWLARATGTVFITRDPRAAMAQQQVFENRLLAGHRLLFFPEGTSTDGRTILPFKSTLFQAFFSDNIESELHIQPVTVIYRAPSGQDKRFYGWWGEMGFAPHLIQVLASFRQGTVTVRYHALLKIAAFTGRKALAEACEAQVRAGLPEDVRD